jgi:hypothetical protein
MHLKTTSVRRQNMKIGFRVLTCIQRGILWVDIVMGETDLLKALRSEGVLNRGEEESRLVFGTGAGVLVSRSACDGSAWQPLSRLVGLVHGLAELGLATASSLLTLRRSSLMRTRRFTIRAGVNSVADFASVLSS